MSFRGPFFCRESIEFCADVVETSNDPAAPKTTEKHGFPRVDGADDPRFPASGFEGRIGSGDVAPVLQTIRPPLRRAVRTMDSSGAATIAKTAQASCGFFAREAPAPVVRVACPRSP